MPSFNRVTLIGHLTRDPGLKYLPSQTAVTDFGLAMNRQWKGQDNQKHEEVTFVDVTAYAKQAEIINQYLKKGSPIFIEGRLTYQSWTGQDGTKRHKLFVTMENFQFVGGQSGSQKSQTAKEDKPPPSEAPSDDSEPAQAPPKKNDIPF